MNISQINHFSSVYCVIYINVLFTKYPGKNNFLAYLIYDSVTMDVRVAMGSSESIEGINSASNRPVLLTSLRQNEELHIKLN